MPYISADSKNEILDGKLNNPGKLSYMIAGMINEYMKQNGISYQSYNDVSGVLSLLDKEVYRRFVSSYEQYKMIQNGDVFTFQRDQNEEKNK